ncbi:imelysin family protein [Psychrobacter sanguinis]|uniref:imelysin family protein n=1 Tax=Psychrobacter sanguinis TaxID=861445 RepID=UPI00191B392C|nr:imelysin family protein [Psychrobacter sanguinis]MCC3309328.1 imelysin family protein [Psychrobacter sanguinis]UEC26599.1 imelysin family protein [Psychrobacter sanguinis]
MKKYQLTAMVLSALSASILISCTKPNEDTQTTAKEQDVAVKETPTTPSANSNNTNNGVNIKTIDIDPNTAESYLTEVANNQILTAYQNVVEQSSALGSLATQSCQTGSAVSGEQLTALRAQWLELAKAWAQAEVVGFGPAMNSMSNLYINYYPDERGLVHQGVIDLIAANPTLTADQLASESAIVQGIPGLEEVLYANDSLTKEQCQYVVSASEALTARLSDVQKAWQESPEQLLGIGGDQNKTGLNRWINSVLALVETTKSTSLDQPLGITGNKKGHLPAAAAGQSRAIITAKVAALNKALTDPALVAILSDNGNDTLADEMSTLLAEASTLLAQLPEDFAQATPDQQKALYEKLTELTQVIKRQLMPTLGIQVGFNSTDGD